MACYRTYDLIYESYDACRSAGKWRIDLIKPLLPRIYMIIEEINERFAAGCGKIPG
ncbi:glycogen/starch/alpha-glucan phosphorylase [Bacillus licheniformis]|nr:glycogen/starch/alpha-glucan phosphorylase [Bacillus licheniformis]